MRQLIPNYTFNAAAKTVTLIDFTTLKAERVILIVDQTINTILYNIVDSTITTAAISGNVITLGAVPGGAASTDKLMVAYDAQASDPTYDQEPVLDQQLLMQLLRGIAALSRPEHYDSANNALRVTQIAPPTGPSGTLSSVAQVTNLVNLGSGGPANQGFDARLSLLFATERNFWADAVRARVT